LNGSASVTKLHEKVPSPFVVAYEFEAPDDLTHGAESFDTNVVGSVVIMMSARAGPTPPRNTARTATAQRKRRIAAPSDSDRKRVSSHAGSAAASNIRRATRHKAADAPRLVQVAFADQ
jgi:hypothetical protein